MTPDDIREIFRREMFQPVGGPIDNLIESKLRAGARQFVSDALSPPRVSESLRNASAVARKWSGNLPVALESFAGPLLDKLDVWAADPETARAVSRDALSVVMPLLD